MADILWQIWYGRYITADILWQIYYGNGITTNILRQIYYIRYVTADTLRQIHYGRYIAHHKNNHIFTNVHRQKLSTAASESTFVTYHPSEPRDLPHGPESTPEVCLGNPPAHFVMYT